MWLAEHRGTPALTCQGMHAGPRRNGEGTEDEEQGIIAAESTPTG